MDHISSPTFYSVGVRNVRPHPSPLPQERERRWPRVRNADPPGRCALLAANGTATVTPGKSVEFPGDARTSALPMKPGRETFGKRSRARLRSRVRNAVSLRGSGVKKHEISFGGILSPGERESCGPRAHPAAAPDWRGLLSANHTMAVMLGEPLEFTGDVLSCSLSLGEWVWVWASVHPPKPRPRFACENG